MVVLKSQKEYLNWKDSLGLDECLGFVPTMGALHLGHLSLVERSLKECHATVVSIFLNPLQFSENEDLNNYPVDIEGDLKKLDDMNVSAVFVPLSSEMYKKDDSFSVVDNSFSRTLEGNSRPQFFVGVLTVVSKLFNIIQPQRAYFGLKDAQQYLLVKKMVQDLKYPIEIVPCPTIREKNGLAMSSRNNYLSGADQDKSKIIFEAIATAEKSFRDGCRNAITIKNSTVDCINKETGISIDYVSVLNLDTFKEVGEEITSNVLLSLAVTIADTRLIDNIFLTLN